MTYYLVLARYTPTSPWAIEFGDYDKRTATDEVMDAAAHYPAARLLKVASDLQADIDAAVAALNAKGV